MLSRLYNLVSARTVLRIFKEELQTDHIDDVYVWTHWEIVGRLKDGREWYVAKQHGESTDDVKYQAGVIKRLMERWEGR